MLVRSAVPIISGLIVIIIYWDFKLVTRKIFVKLNQGYNIVLTHLILYIITWIFPEKVKSILYIFSNKFPKAKSALF